ncbi:hypothetical protein WALSEDRAFT_60199 [Wallemia mellicola CBS 633.66]|uniref:Autophagy-related protein 101 n=1 Tax=Wallemia mellicola (strain ATCC MYA-4683 / CBS 633.66) TaxID=671144 RepID=I4YE01_WALMC|nr:hypothetical protein WALSEDRAFT_60199 [Wallemia mellicola CBS 633.66]TIB83439.1 hypothetical protein E3Q21_02900 [Wallemia mellicola]EIM22193.1 hypothetical protein WALSEDRAFT_60199 [Wallemia mellicola CBS 633.66]TIB86281.1 hypothetical protein E3Q20_02892 [Wallemia mellicola]TIB91082.1 hypothetical protein E3Q19_02570 [Wallemia mellicola]TIC22154.1 hypothetical protein E3Q12_02886 [Wallemia mellicola]|eukprot:XP_006957988.1 hypothetical protein WALSEDRAFT_60199 [Wallemia mellicola CBS 633.66]
MTVTKTLTITVDKAYLEDVCAGILHSMLFQRTLGNFKPKELAVLDVPMPAIESASIGQLVQRYAQELSATSTDRGVLALVLAETQSRRTNHWFGFGEQETTTQVPWETWIVNFNILISKSENHKQILYTNTQNDLQKALLQILAFADERKDHIPPIMTADLTPFPFHIVVNPPEGPPTRSGSPQSLAVAEVNRVLSGEKHQSPNSYFSAPLHSIAKRITSSNNSEENH